MLRAVLNGRRRGYEDGEDLATVAACFFESFERVVAKLG
jgi:hypothetical protein